MAQEQWGSRRRRADVRRRRRLPVPRRRRTLTGEIGCITDSTIVAKSFKIINENIVTPMVAAPLLMIYSRRPDVDPRPFRRFGIVGNVSEEECAPLTLILILTLGNSSEEEQVQLHQVRPAQDPRQHVEERHLWPSL